MCTKVLLCHSSLKEYTLLELYPYLNKKDMYIPLDLHYWTLGIYKSAWHVGSD